MCMRDRGRATNGFTLTELMIVVAIIGVMSALAAPSFNKDNRAREGRSLAADVARDLQKCTASALISPSA